MSLLFITMHIVSCLLFISVQGKMDSLQVRSFSEMRRPIQDD